MAHSIEKLVSRIDGFQIVDIGRLQMNCDRHGVFFSNGKRLRRREIWSGCGSCESELEAADAEERRIAAIRSAAYERGRLLSRAAIPARFADKTLESFKAESPEQSRALGVARSYAEQWNQSAEKGAWLVFSGPPGTGKSHLAIAILQSILPRHVGRYMTCMELIQTLRSTWRKDSERSEMDVLDEITQVPLLVIDELGVQYGTDSEQNHLFDVLDRRYREMMPTILLTNQNKDGLRALVGDRVYDRMTEVARWVPFTWPSYRPQARREIGDA